MNTNLKNLVEIKKQGVKEFKFLTSVKQYIEENYREIQDSLNLNNIIEVVDEIIENSRKDGDDEPSLLVYRSIDELTTLSRNDFNCRSRTLYNKEGLDKFAIEFPEWYDTLLNFATLDDVYFINDYKAYKAYAEELKAKYNEERIANAEKVALEKIAVERKSEEDRKAKVVDDIRLREKFNLGVNDNTDRARLFESIFQNDKLDVQFKAFNELMNELPSTDHVKEMIDDAIDSHEWNEH